MELDGIIKFIKLTHDFQKVERMLYATGLDRKENDVEHSYQLAMVGWYIASVNKLDLNIDQVVRYGLIHDLVEVHAGDTYAFDKNAEVHETKAQREYEALEKIKHDFQEFPELATWIEKYESREDEESKFIYALDKILPDINIYLDGGRTWKEMKEDWAEIVAHDLKKISGSSHIQKYFLQLKELVDSEQHKLFHKQDEKI